MRVIFLFITAVMIVISLLFARQVTASHRTDYLRQDTIRSGTGPNEICIDGNQTSSYRAGYAVELQQLLDQYFDVISSSYDTSLFCPNQTLIEINIAAGFMEIDDWVRVYSNDTTPPTISNISAGSITQTSATITWTTNENADSKVDYGTTTNYGSIKSSSTLTTSHSLAL